jgi:hypothetical protein
MVDKKYKRYVNSFLLVLPMTGLVTGINTLVARGAQAVLTFSTLQRWGISFAVAFPTILFIAPLAAKATDYFIKNE